MSELHYPRGDCGINAAPAGVPDVRERYRRTRSFGGFGCASAEQDVGSHIYNVAARAQKYR